MKTISCAIPAAAVAVALAGCGGTVATPSRATTATAKVAATPRQPSPALYDAAAQSSPRVAEVTMEPYATGNNGAYTGGTVAQLVKIESTITTHPTSGQAWLRAATPDASGQGYTVTATAGRTAQTFSISRADNGRLTFDCTGNAGGCVGGHW